MRIAAINSANGTNNNVKKYNQSFGGLSRIMRKTVIAMPHKEAERYIASIDKPHIFVGYFPSDVMKIIMRQKPSHEQLGDKIRKFNESFASQADKIRSYDKKVIE